MSSRPASRSRINQLNIASMVILLIILIFFVLKDTFPFQTQKWIYLILGILLIVVDVLRIREVYKLGHRKLLLVRIVTTLMVTGFVGYWWYLHF
ncbi:hypothetical protein [Nonlabens agnitus]|uniref:DUF4181 domain-containing protein n=1 Tax=Nonlabens agnitus TaxID=870484 RepID=A0A2S9WVC1_9FLAO|nr:hypothetical protein [Nonlabens agnitus]PRP67414.1 hypothetical protein BST86_10075 [Nonlabens agnitus]